MATDVERLVLQMNADIKKMEASLARARAQTEKSTTAIEKRFDQMNTKVSRTGDSMAESIRRSIAGIGVGLAIKETVAYADAWTSASNKIAAAGVSNAELATTMADLARLARETRTEFGATADLYARVTRVSRELGLSQEEVRKITENTNKAFVAGGASASEQASSITQLGQALGSAVLQGDELKALRENAPLLAQAIADEFGVTIGELKKLGAEGALASDRVARAILKADTIQAQFGRTTATVAQSFTNLQTAFTQYIGEADRAGGATRNLSNFINGVANNFDQFADAIVIAGFAIGGVVGARGLALLAGQLAGVSLATTGAVGALRALQVAMIFLSSPLGAGVVGLGVALIGLALAAQKPAEKIPTLTDRIVGLRVEMAKTDEVIDKFGFDHLTEGAKAALPPLTELEKKIADIKKGMVATGAVAKQLAVDSLVAERIGVQQGIRTLEEQFAAQRARIDAAAENGVAPRGPSQTLARIAQQLSVARRDDAAAAKRISDLLRLPAAAFKAEPTAGDGVGNGDQAAKLNLYTTALEDYEAVLKEIAASQESASNKTRAGVQALLDYARATDDVTASARLSDIGNFEGGIVAASELKRLADEAGAAGRDVARSFQEALAAQLQAAEDETFGLPDPEIERGEYETAARKTGEAGNFLDTAEETAIKDTVRASVKLAFREGVVTGDWGDSVRSILASAVTSAFDKSLDRLADLVGDLLLGTDGNQGWLQAAGNFALSYFSSGAGRAAGGPTSPFTAHPVNEMGKGEFLFMGKNPGQVLTAAQLNGLSAGSGPRGAAPTIHAPLIIQGDLTEGTLGRVQQMLDANNRRIMSAMPGAIDARVIDSRMRRRI